MNKQPAAPITDEVVDRFFREINSGKLSEWESKFLLSTKEWWGKNRKLSDKQKKRLSEIWRKQRNENPPAA